MAIPVYEIIFYVMAAMLIASSLLVVFSARTVQAALWLIFSFLITSVLWMMMQAEFLSLVLIFVYVGAVMTLFLFVVMMINQDKERKKYRRGLIPLAFFIGVLLAVVLLIIIKHSANSELSATFSNALQIFPRTTLYSNTQQMGRALFTKHLIAFELAAILLLIAIIGAISLAFFGKKLGVKRQKISLQHKANKPDGLKMVDLPKGDQQ